MKGNCKLLLFSLMALAIALVPTGSGFGGAQTQPPKAEAQPEGREGANCLQGAPADNAELQKHIDNCYLKLMSSYACAALAGGEVERKAKENLEQFYRALHNNSTVGIDKVYNKAKERGCKEKSPPSHILKP